MRITLKLFAGLTEYLPADKRTGNRMEMDVESGARVADVIALAEVPEKKVHLVLVNGVFVPPEQRATHALAENDVLALWPPVAGG